MAPGVKITGAILLNKAAITQGQCLAQKTHSAPFGRPQSARHAFLSNTMDRTRLPDSGSIVSAVA